MEKDKDKGKIYLKVLVNLLIYVVSILCLIFFLPKVVNFFLPFIIGWIIATIANPLVRFLEKRVKIVRKHSSAIVIIFVIALVILVIYGGVRLIVYQASSFIEDVPSIVALLNDRLNQVSEKLSGLVRVLPSGLQESIGKFSDNIMKAINSFIASEKVSEATISFARNFIDYILVTFIIFISAYFFIKDRNTLLAKVRKSVPKSVIEKYDMIAYYFKYAVGGYFKAQFKIMFIIIIIMFIGFNIIGSKYSLLIAILTGFIDVLPVFGTGFILWPWAFFEFVVGNYFEAVSLLIIYLVCQLVKNILQPKMVGDSVGLDPLATLLFMYIGYRLAGLLGMIIAIPIGLVLANLYRVGMFDNMKRGIKIIIDEVNQYRKF